MIITSTAWSRESLTHGEGPVWDARAGRLRCVDLLAGDLVDFDLDGTATRTSVGAVAAAWRPRRGGGLVVAVERGFALLDADGSLHPLPELWDDPTVRMNDGATDPEGRFYCGSMAYDVRPGAGTLWLLDGSGNTRQVLTGVTISNGLAWTPDGTAAYYVDTPEQRIDVLEFAAEGSVAGRRPFVHVPPEVGAPDGLTVDAQGGVWVALWGGAAVHRYDPDGTLSAVIPVDTPQPTACTFGGPDLDLLFITTSTVGLTDPGAAAGRVHLARPGVRGLATVDYDDTWTTAATTSTTATTPASSAPASSTPASSAPASSGVAASGAAVSGVTVSGVTATSVAATSMQTPR